MTLTIKQRSQLVRAAERGLDRKQSGYKILAWCLAGMVVMLVLAVMGVV